MSIILEIKGSKRASPYKYGALFRKAASFLSRDLGLNGVELEISVAFVEDSTMKNFNSRFRGENKTTDVLSFNEVNEILISPAQALRQAKAAGYSLEREMVFLLVHGLLHLLGYEDRTKKGWSKMMDLGKKVVAMVFKG